MSSFEYFLNDKKGNPVEIGDKIKVFLPTKVIPNFDPDDGNQLYIGWKVLKGVLHLFLSRGLVLKITEIVDYESEDDSDIPLDCDLKVGQFITFRRTSWTWSKINE